MIGIFVVFSRVEIGDLVFFRGCPSEINKKNEIGTCQGQEPLGLLLGYKNQGRIQEFLKEEAQKL